MVDWSRIHENRRFALATLPLALCSLLYGLGVRFRLMACRMRKEKTLPGVVVSIGNLTAGGTGKTPAACMVAKWALREGYRVAILSRGYGGRHKGRVLEVSDGNRNAVDVDEYLHGIQFAIGYHPYPFNVCVVLRKKP